MGSRSKTQSTSINETITDESVIDLANSTRSQAVELDGIDVGEGSFALTLSDFGAIDNAKDTMLASLDYADKAGREAWSHASNIVDQALSQARSVVSTTDEEQSKQFIKYGAALVGLLIIVMVFKK